jgi:hypothetical protein
LRRRGTLAAPPADPLRGATRDPPKGVDDPLLFSLELLRPTAVAQPISFDLNVENPFEALGLGCREIAGQASDAVDLPVAPAPRSDDHNAADSRKKLDDHVRLDFYPSKRYATPAIPVV